MIYNLYVRPQVTQPPRVSLGEILHFKHLPRVSAWPPGSLERINNKVNKDDSFFRLNFNVFIDVDNREKARLRVKKKGDQFRWEWESMKFLYWQ